MKSSINPPRHPRSHRRARAFTLVEMLVVMAIIAILLAVSVPALKGLNGTGTRKSAVRTLMGVLDQARMMAISDGRSTYVVFAGANLVNSGGCEGMMGRTYAVFEDGLDFVPVQRSAWIKMPAGVSFKMAADYSTLVNRTLVTADPAFTVVVPKAGGKTTVVTQLPYMKFDSTGAVDSALANDDVAQHFRLLLFEGSVSANGAEVASRRASDKNVLLDEIRINPATGRAKYTLNPADNLPATSS